ncbi:MAG: CBS domain-containing protein, partial [Ktedonobacterales bacterium]
QAGRARGTGQPSLASLAPAAATMSDSAFDGEDDEDDEGPDFGAVTGRPLGGGVVAGDHEVSVARLAGRAPDDGDGDGDDLLARTPPPHDDPLRSVRVAEAMLTTPRLVRESDLASVARRLLEDHGASLMVVDEAGQLVGILTRSDLHYRADQKRGRLLTVGDVAVRNLVTTRPNETLRVAISRMNRLGLRQLPVVAGDIPGPPLGLLRRGDILSAYERATSARKTEESLAGKQTTS